MNKERFNKFFKVNPNGWYDVSKMTNDPVKRDAEVKALVEYISAVLNSVTDIYEEMFGVDYFYSKPTLITEIAHYKDDRPFDPKKVKKWPSSPGCRSDNKEIFLNTGETYWCQYIYQFGQMLYWYIHHNHCNKSFSDNQLLFVRSFPIAFGAIAINESAIKWSENAPYQNWTSYSKSLKEYFNDMVKQYLDCDKYPNESVDKLISNLIFVESEKNEQISILENEIVKLPSNSDKLIELLNKQNEIIKSLSDYKDMIIYKYANIILAYYQHNGIAPLINNIKILIESEYNLNRISMFKL